MSENEDSISSSKSFIFEGSQNKIQNINSQSEDFQYHDQYVDDQDNGLLMYLRHLRNAPTLYGEDGPEYAEKCVEIIKKLNEIEENKRKRIHERKIEKIKLDQENKEKVYERKLEAIQSTSLTVILVVGLLIAISPLESVVAVTTGLLLSGASFSGLVYRLFGKPSKDRSNNRMFALWQPYVFLVVTLGMLFLIRNSPASSQITIRIDNNTEPTPTANDFETNDNSEAAIADISPRISNGTEMAENMAKYIVESTAQDHGGDIQASRLVFIFMIGFFGTSSLISFYSESIKPESLKKELETPQIQVS